MNDITGHDLDSRDATFGKAQLLLDADEPVGGARSSYSGERARDGDYALNDLGGAARESLPCRRATSKATPIAT